MLESAKAKQAQAVKAAEDILAAARDEAERMRHEGEAELKRSLAAREAQAMDRIALAEQNAIQSVKVRAVEIAIRAATGLVAQSIDQQAANALVDRAIDDLPRRAAV
jgi:F-type H+-transporting ATPase subunit b